MSRGGNRSSMAEEKRLVKRRRRWSKARLRQTYRQEIVDVDRYFGFLQRQSMSVTRAVPVVPLVMSQRIVRAVRAVKGTI